jgi:hypothetical protein
MEAKHTPGPWFYGIAYEPEKGEQPLSYRGPGYYQNPGLLSASGETIVGCDEYDIFGPLREEEREANICLIAAAPELLAVAQFFLKGIEGGHIKCASYIDFDPDAENLEIKSPADRLRAAIAKATGSAS